MDNDPPWRSIQFIVELIRQNRVDLIHAHLPRAHVLAGLAGRLANKPVVATIHGMDISTQELGIARTTGSHLTVVCQEAYSQALVLGVTAEKLTLIPNGVDTRAYHPNRSGTTFRKVVNIPINAPLVGFVGRLAWEKGPDQFVLAAEYVHKTFPGAHFVLVGEGPMELEIRDRIRNAGAEDYIHLAGVWPATREVYPALDILAQTSRVEGMPFALLEAMACGKPVVAMGVGGVAEIVEVGSTGFLSAQGDWIGLGNAIIKILSDPDLGKPFGITARKRVEELFDLKMSIRKLSDLFCRLTNHPAVVEKSRRPEWKMVESEQESMAFDRATLFPKKE
jgi:glycosyltransferase involved in cell wall biosynthesis